jgi:hypothetical protein
MQYLELDHDEYLDDWDDSSEETPQLKLKHNRERTIAHIRTLKLQSHGSENLLTNPLVVGFRDANRLLRKQRNAKILKLPATLAFMEAMNSYIAMCWMMNTTDHRKITFERTPEWHAWYNHDLLQNLEAKHALYLAEINWATTPNSPPSDTL